MGNIDNQDAKNAAIQDRLRDEEDQLDQERTDEQIEEDNREPEMKAPVVKDNPLQQKDVNEGADAKSYQVNKVATRTRKAPTKAVVPSNLVEIYKEKIELITYIEEAVSTNVPEVNMSKGGRDIILAMNKAIEEAKNKALIAIQSL